MVGRAYGRRSRAYRPSNSWSGIFIKQLIVCIIIVLCVIVIKKMDIAIVNKQIENLEAYLTMDISKSELEVMASTSIEKIKSVPTSIATAFKASDEKMAFSPPIDQVINDKSKEIVVYSIGGGTVSQVDENEKIGKYIKIVHENGMESIYGSLNSVQVEDLNKVKKGQIIGTFENKENNALYFALLKDGKTVNPDDYITF